MEFSFRRAAREDAAKIFAGIKSAGTEQGSYLKYYEDPGLYLEQILEGYSAVALNPEGELIGAFTITSSTDDRDVYDYVSLRKGEKPLLFDTVYVKPEYRGMGLHAALCKKAMEYAAGCFTDGYTTIHPENTPSLKSMQRCGFSVLRDDLMWDVGPRVLLHRKL